jgi:hypothetical protein
MPRPAQAPTISGTLAAVNKRVITVSHTGGKANTLHNIYPDATITRNGSVVTLSELHLGDLVSGDETHINASG